MQCCALVNAAECMEIQTDISNLGKGKREREIRKQKSQKYLQAWVSDERMPGLRSELGLFLIAIIDTYFPMKLAHHNLQDKSIRNCPL